MDQSGPTGMPPPSGVTDANEAKKPESGATSTEGKADTVPATGTGRSVGSEVPTAQAAQESANISIAVDEIEEEEVLEGSGQAEPDSKPEIVDNPSKDAERPSSEEVPTAEEVEEQAHNAMVDDETGHVHLANGKRIGSPITPSTSGTATPVDEPTTFSATGDTRPPISAVSESPAEIAEVAKAAAAAKGAIEPSNVAADPEDEKAADEAAPVVPLEVKGTPARAAETGSLAKPNSRAGSVAMPQATSEQEDADVMDSIIRTSSHKAEAGEGAAKGAAAESKVVATQEGQALPGTRTQEQEAGKGEMVGESVAD